MTVEEVFAYLKPLGNESVRKHNTKYGADDNQFGVKHGDIRALAKKIKTDHALGLALWETGNAEAQLLAILILKPKELSAKEVDRLVRTINFPHVAEWFSSYILKQHPDKETLRQKWMKDDHKWAARAGWSLTASKVAKNPDYAELVPLLVRIENEMAGAPSEVQWTMNYTLAEIGINFAEYRQRAIAIGEKLGIYRDYPVSKGCTSPFAPIWIAEMVKRQG